MDFKKGVKMKIQPIQHNRAQQRIALDSSAEKTNNHNPSFGALRLTSYGAAAIAKDLLKRPDLQDSFVKRVVEPLKKCKTDVLYDSSKVHIKIL